MSKQKFKYIDLNSKIEEVREGGMSGVQVVDLYKKILMAKYAIKEEDKNKPELVIIDAETVKQGVDISKLDQYTDPLELGTRVAVGLYSALNGLILWRELGLNVTEVVKSTLEFVEYAATLDNKFIKENLITNGKGWKIALKRMIQGEDSLGDNRKAAIICVIGNPDHIAFEEGRQWFVPNLDEQIKDEVAFEKLVVEFAKNHAMSETKETKERIADKVKKVSAAFDSISKSMESKTEQLFKSTEKQLKDVFEKNEKKKETKVKEEPKPYSSSSSDSDETWKTVAKVAGGVAAIGLAAFAGWKAYEYFNTTEVMSSNDGLDGLDGFSGFNW